MKIPFLIFAMLMTTNIATADTAKITTIVDEYILPRFETLRNSTAKFSITSEQTCDVTDAQLNEDFHHAFDAWIAVSHLRFGPTETEDRAFALAYWPDNRGKTPKALRRLILNKDTAIASQRDFEDVSIAARGFYAMDFLMFDDEIGGLPHDDYKCKLVRRVAKDIASLAHKIADDWQNSYSGLLRTAGKNERYQSPEEAMQELFKAVATGFQFTAEARLGRPLGTFDKPSPKRAEARRSGRSLRNVVIAVENATNLALLLSGKNESLLARYERLGTHFIDDTSKIHDPVFAGVATPQSRIKIEVIQQSVNSLLDHTLLELGPYLGVSEGFNALDGD